MQFWCVDPDKDVDNDEDNDREEHGEITDQLSDKGGENCGLFEVLEYHGNEECSKEEQNAEEENVRNVFLSVAVIFSWQVRAAKNEQQIISVI